MDDITTHRSGQPVKSAAKCVKPLQMAKLQQHCKIEVEEDTIAVPTARNFDNELPLN
jgi:hypothetical protein